MSHCLWGCLWITILAGCTHPLKNMDLKKIDCDYARIQSIALGINGYAVQHYDIAGNAEIVSKVFHWFDEHREGWRICKFRDSRKRIHFRPLLSGEYHYRHIGILWANDAIEKYRWYYRHA